MDYGTSSINWSPQTVINDSLDEAAVKRFELMSNAINDDTQIPDITNSNSAPEGKIHIKYQPLKERDYYTKFIDSKVENNETKQDYCSSCWGQTTGFSLISTRLVKALKEKERKYRISKALKILKQARNDIELNRIPQSCVSRSLFLKDNGYMGVALFSPLDAAFTYDNDVLLFYCTALADSEIEEATCKPENASKSIVEKSVAPIFEPELTTVLIHTPHILSNSLVQEIDRVLPFNARNVTWRRVYSLNRDGDSFSTFLNKVQHHSRTILVIRTKSGSIFGSFADTEWGQRFNSKQKSFYGKGESFLFSVKDARYSEDDKYQEGVNQLKVFKWTGRNYYIQLCDVNEERIAMGGGGSHFGLCLQDNFTRGSSGWCDTFDNDSLDANCYFEILDFDIYSLAFSSRATFM